ncbi:hypothetical protein FA95DRAFT_1679280 [Auriscalpium vulgare]|uniref:Uncharacterized protein n=1 Tax=Auriscalpium vulgare TaxID=40419 RepID=A0ACB8RT50_9AGAM|nr:hypothetical protein FA95DRAFT_1679280 [Auriscalpium vulgare]
MTLQIWAARGGTIARSDTERRSAQYYFCNGLRDPWVEILAAKSLVVFDAAWIHQSVNEGFCVSIARYVLDEATNTIVPKPARYEHTRSHDHGTLQAPGERTRKRRVDEMESPEPPNRDYSNKRARIHHAVVDEDDRDLANNKDRDFPKDVCRLEQGLVSEARDLSSGRDVICKPTVDKQDKCTRPAEGPIKHLDLVFELARVRGKRRFGFCPPPALPPARRVRSNDDKSVQRTAPPASPRSVNFLEAVYGPACELRSRRFTVPAALVSLRGVSIADTCEFKAGKKHLGEDFQTLSLGRGFSI